MSRFVCTAVFFFACAFLLSSGTYFLYSSTMVNLSMAPQRFQFNFIPSRYQVCEHLFVNTSESEFSFSPKYKLINKEFNEAVNNASVGPGGIEGYSGQMRAQYLAMHYLARQPVVKTVCETGFNLGHSSFNYLTANDDVIVHSFDLGGHHYAQKMSKYLAKIFPNRLFVHFGDSTKTIPEFIADNPGFRCDYIFVDGGHVYPVAIADLRNFAQIANLEENIIIFDDYPTNWGGGFGKAWEDAIAEGLVKEVMRCTFRDRPSKSQRGFVVGRVVTRPAAASSTDKLSILFP